MAILLQNHEFLIGLYGFCFDFLRPVFFFVFFFLGGGGGGWDKGYYYKSVAKMIELLFLSVFNYSSSLYMQHVHVCVCVLGELGVAGWVSVINFASCF